MVKSVLGVNHQGLTDWALQRMTAVFMTLGIFAFIIFLIIHPNLSFIEWQRLFSYLSVKILSVIFLFSMAYHAWVGIWTVLTDYVKNTLFRAFLDIVVIFTLIVTFIWGVMILWGI